MEIESETVEKILQYDKEKKFEDEALKILEAETK